MFGSLGLESLQLVNVLVKDTPCCGGRRTDYVVDSEKPGLVHDEAAWASSIEMLRKTDSASSLTVAQ